MSNDEIQQLSDTVAALKKELAAKSRNLEVEASLEKVRSRTMTMRSSAELSETSTLLFHELKQLGIKAIRTGVGIFDDANDAMELWVTSESDNKDVLKVLDYFSLYIHPVYENLIPARRQQKPFALTSLQGTALREYYQSMSTYLSLQEQYAHTEEEFFYSFFFEQGALNVITRQALTDEECAVMVRFATAFGLIYTRFLDLQKAEEQTREVMKKAALDRVRAEIASMRTTGDLERITPLVWRELIALGVPFFRCGVFIVSEDEQVLHAYLSTPGGKSIAVLHLDFAGNDISGKIVESWRNRQVYKDHWTQAQFQDWVQSMFDQGQISTTEQYQAGEESPLSLSLQFIPFSQGMLYVGSHEPLEDDEIELVKSLADTFSVAYARYEDFKQLEAAKERIEATLDELKATQSQLIQSEKMASLGELTAGIAHEIQNPLNFVNNFSELNRELIAEMNEEIEKGNFEEVKRIAGDIAENEEKIIHHGKRADGIVKGMLQHSRSNTGQKELTDINELTDEYLRLAYHGLRAKDKSFNAKFEADFDAAAGKISIVPQEVGRVILNLINNAFYAVTEKRMQDIPGYEPFVVVTTKRFADKIEIAVKDNGNGVPQKVMDKIFQPFFTTKPTGKGTGLGLSLSYDIVKTHGGELLVESNEGEFARFSIILPV